MVPQNKIVVSYERPHLFETYPSAKRNFVCAALAALTWSKFTL